MNYHLGSSFSLVGKHGFHMVTVSPWSRSQPLWGVEASVPLNVNGDDIVLGLLGSGIDKLLLGLDKRKLRVKTGMSSVSLALKAGWRCGLGVLSPRDS